MNGNQTYAVRQMVEQLESQVETLQTQASAFNTAAANTQVLFRDGTTINGDSNFTFDNVNDLVTLGTNTTTTVPARRLRAFGNIRIDSGDNNPNGVELRVIGNVVPYHNLSIINGLTNAFASNSDHTHVLWQNFSSGVPNSRTQHQQLYTVSTESGGTTSFVSHGLAQSAIGVEFTNESSIDTTATTQTPVAPDNIGRVLLRYSVNPSIIVGENLLLQISSVPVAGLQAAVYSVTSATASTLVSGFWEVQVDVFGLDPLHWNWNNRANTSLLNGNWALFRTTTPLSNLVSVAPVAGDTNALDLTWSSLPSEIAIGRPCAFLIKSATTLTGITAGNMYAGYVYSVTGLTSRVRLRNSRYRFSWGIGGTTDSTPSRYSIFSGLRDQSHEPVPSHVHTVVYRDNNGSVTNLIYGNCDVISGVTRSVTLGYNLLASSSDTVLIGTDNVSNSMSLNGNILTINRVATQRVDVGGLSIIPGAGSPEGVVTAPVGSLYLRSDGGAGTTLYVKQSGTGNTGWVAK
jgi:hypothetical protein